MGKATKEMKEEKEYLDAYLDIRAEQESQEAQELNTEYGATV
jgi:hypothetical protein